MKQSKGKDIEEQRGGRGLKYKDSGKRITTGKRTTMMGGRTM